MEKGKYILINIPIGRNWHQDGTADNPYEEHKSVWYNSDFTKYKHKIIKSFNDFTLRDFSVILLSAQKIKWGNRFGKFFFVKNFIKHKLGLKRLLKKL